MQSLPKNLLFSNIICTFARQNEPNRGEKTMNFEEMIAMRNARKTNKVLMPYGYFYKRQIDERYTNFVEFHDELAENIFFTNGVKKECEFVSTFEHKAQLHFTSNEGDEGVYAIAVEVGNYLTLGQLLNDDPSIVVRNEFIHSVLNELMDITISLNDEDVYHVCFAPSNVLVRKTDNAVRLLCHGSFYSKVEQDVLWDGVEEYVAPEVMSGGTIDGRSEVYSMGKFIAYLYESSGMPFELKKIVQKATATNPEDRFESVYALRNTINKVTTMKRTTITAVAAIAIAAAVVGLFFYLLPSPEVIEYVKPVEDVVPDEMVEEDMDALIGIGADADSATIAAVVEMQKQKKDSLGMSEGKLREYNSKAEAIFRKQFTKAADEIISKVYTPSNMNGDVNAFAAKSKRMTEELAKKQEELMKAAAINGSHAQRIASEIIEQITEKKKEVLDKDYMGLKNVPQEKSATTKSAYSSSSSESTTPKTTTTTTPTTSSSSDKKSNKDIYSKHRDKYGIDPYDPVDPENHQLRKK